MIIQTGMRTDIPAFNSKWFLNRLREGYVLVRNPYDPRSVTRYRLDPAVVDLIAFCTKNPDPMLDRMDALKDYGQYWFVTITPYGRDVEPNVPDKETVMEDFKRLSDIVGADSMGWRYDPILINDRYPLERHIEDFERMAKRFEDKDSTKRKLITSAIYPIIVALVFLIAVFAVAASWKIMGVAYAVAAVYAIVIVSAISFFQAGKQLGRSTVFGGQILLHIPILGKNIMQSELADFAGNMAVFYSSGVDIDRGMEYSMKTIRYTLLREKIAKAAKTVRKGIPLSDALQMQDIFPPDLIHCLRIGENSGNADGMLQKISEYYSTDVRNRREILMTVLRQ